MNCRIVEGVTLHGKTIAPLLRAGFVESRVHMDYPARIQPDLFRVHRLLQQELIGDISVPHYAILDPETGEFLATNRLRGGSPDAWARDFVSFLQLPAPRTNK